MVNSVIFFENFAGKRFCFVWFTFCGLAYNILFFWIKSYWVSVQRVLLADLLSIVGRENKRIEKQLIDQVNFNHTKEMLSLPSNLEIGVS